MKICACDVDLTVVDSALHWYNWLEDKTKANLPIEEVYKHYDFSIPYGPIWASKGLSGCPLDFWRGQHVYDEMKPLEGAVEALRAIKEKGYLIVFVSVLKGNHHKSKYEFLEKHFPFMDGFVGTKEKWTVAASIIIDDRNRYLNMFEGSKVLRLKKNTPHSQDIELEGGCLSFTEWGTLQTYIPTILDAYNLK